MKTTFLFLLSIILFVSVINNTLICQQNNYGEILDNLESLQSKCWNINKDLMDYKKSFETNTLEYSIISDLIKSGLNFTIEDQHFFNYMEIFIRARKYKDKYLDNMIRISLKTIKNEMEHEIEDINLSLTYTNNIAIADAGKELKELIRKLLALYDAAKN
jgi:hypothetical protein